MASSEDGSLTVSVSDNGRGIAKERLASIFRQSRKEDSQRYGGFGLGLNLSKMLVALHNGEIWVDSVLNKGSTFGFKIPLQTSQQ